MRLRKRLTRAAAARAVRLLAAIARRLPDRSIRAVGHVLGDTGRRCAPSLAARACRNIERVFPDWSDKRRQQVARSMFQHLGVSVLEAVRLPRTAVARRMPRLTVLGIETLDAACRRGRGVVVATAHLGNWEMLAACFADMGYPVHVVARRHSNPGIDAFIANLREGYGVKVLDRDRDVKGMLRALRDGEIVALLVDQDTRVQGTMLPFMGLPAYTPLGHARLAVRTGAALIVLTITRDTGGHHTARVWEEVAPDLSLSSEARVETMARRCNQILGEAIAAAPEQWVWFHRRWRASAEAVQ